MRIKYKVFRAPTTGPGLRSMEDEMNEFMADRNRTHVQMTWIPGDDNDGHVLLAYRENEVKDSSKKR